MLKTVEYIKVDCQWRIWRLCLSSGRFLLCNIQTLAQNDTRNKDAISFGFCGTTSRHHVDLVYLWLGEIYQIKKLALKHNIADICCSFF